MAHPHRSEATDAHNAKLRSMTTHYGLASGPANNITSPQERLKGEMGESHVGFGADSSAATSRGDRPARRSAAANPVATYAKGGKVKHRDAGGKAGDGDGDADYMNDLNKGRKHGGRTKHRDSGGDVSPIEEANKDQAEAKATGGVIARARGGRTHGNRGHKGATHVNVVVAPQGGAGAPPMGVPPQLAAMAPKPPMPPMAPPPGAGGPPMMPPGPMGAGPGGPPPMMPRAKGGRVMGGHPDAAQDKDLIKKTLREEGLVRKARGGGVHMTAGAVTGEGRLEKMHKKVVPLTQSDAQEV